MWHSNIFPPEEVTVGWPRSEKRMILQKVMDASGKEGL
jgi:hypothetical protein